MSQPRVSFVIPVFNSQQYIARCLQSVRQQQGAATYDVVIMDNGSTDASHMIMRELGFAFHIVPGVNVSTLRNRGVALAQGEYIAFIDSDVEITPQWLQHALAGFTTPEVVASGCFPRVPQDATWVQDTWDVHQRGRQTPGSPYPIAWLPSMNLMVRRHAFLAVQGFNEALQTAEDVDLCYRLGQQGTILCNPAMDAVHWGEARDLRTFWRKEVWRGLGNLRGLCSHGLRWDEIPSLGYPLYMLCAIALLLLSSSVDLWHQRLWFTPGGLLLLALPAVFLAWRTAQMAQRWERFPMLFVLYMIYGFARAYAAVKGLLT